MSPVSSHRLAIAARYWHAAKLVLDHQIRPVEHMEPIGYLLAMASEICLKAFLVDHGWSDRRLSKYLKHDLRKCLREAIQHGLMVAEFEAGCVLNMREAHMTHFNRYGMPALEGKLQLGAVLLTDEGMALECVAMLIDRISGSPKLLRDRHQHSVPVSWPLTLPVDRPVSLGRLEEINQSIEKKLRTIASINADLARQQA